MNAETKHAGVYGGKQIAPFPDPSLEFRAHLLEHLYDGVYYVDLDHRIQYWNRSAQELTGYSAVEVRGQRCSASLLAHRDSSGRPLCGRDCPTAIAMERGETASRQLSLQRRDGDWITLDVHATPIRNPAGRIIGAVQVFRDATPTIELEAAYRKLSEVATRDALTGLLNRRAFLEALEHQIVLHRQTGRALCAVFSDLDHFKSINDTWGHAVGDRILSLVAARFTATCRSRDVIARYGGEEFVILIPDCGLPQATHLAERLRQALANPPPRPLMGRGLTASFGVAELREDDSSASLIVRADQALYRAKRAGRDRVETELDSDSLESEREHPTRTELVSAPVYRSPVAIKIHSSIQ